MSGTASSKKRKPSTGVPAGALFSRSKKPKSTAGDRRPQLQCPYAGCGRIIATQGFANHERGHLRKGHNRVDGEEPEYGLEPSRRSTEQGVYPSLGAAAASTPGRSRPKKGATQHLDQPQPYDESSYLKAYGVPQVGPEDYEQDDDDKKFEIRERANPFEIELNDKPSFNVPNDINRSRFERFVAFLSLRMRFVVWWIFEHFTLLCVSLLIIFALLPDHYSLTLTPTSMLILITLIYVGRSTWAALPIWLQKHVMGEIGDDEDANDCLASPTTIMKKLNEMFHLTYQHSDELLPDDMPQYKIYICVISLLHLLAELYLAFPDWRDKELRSEGEPVSKSELEDLELYLEFADLAYEESITDVISKLRKTGYQLIRHDVATEPGRVGHFIAVNHEEKEVVFAIKGTSSVSDILTDLVGKAVPHTLAGPNGKVVRCHEGIYTAAKMMVEDTQHMIETFFLPAGYSIKLCGHSLGAGVSCLLGVFLKARGIPVQVVAFATPACLSYEASLECCDYITSVVNNSDCVPRVSIMNIRTLNKLFLKLDEKLTFRGLSPTNWQTTRAYLRDLSKVDTDLLMSPEELHDFAENTRREETGLDDDYSLFVAGKVVCMWECNDAKKKSVNCRQMHGGMRTLRHIEVSTRMINDHGTEAYKGNLRLLIESAKD